MPGRKVIPPPATISKDICTHQRAGPKTFRCPDCGGIMRRCCQSVVSWSHEMTCENSPT